MLELQVTPHPLLCCPKCGKQLFLFDYQKVGYVDEKEKIAIWKQSCPCEMETTKASS
jgi:hypothetical protein